MRVCVEEQGYAPLPAARTRKAKQKRCDRKLFCRAMRCVRQPRNRLIYSAVVMPVQAPSRWSRQAERPPRAEKARGMLAGKEETLFLSRFLPQSSPVSVKTATGHFFDFISRHFKTGVLTRFDNGCMMAIVKKNRGIPRPIVSQPLKIRVQKRGALGMMSRKR